MAVTELWLVRHGESVANAAATRAEREGLDVIPLDIRDADVPLSETGEEQADALGTWLAEHRSAIDVFWVSPYLRARQTLAIALERDRSAGGRRGRRAAARPRARHPRPADQARRRPAPPGGGRAAPPPRQVLPSSAGRGVMGGRRPAAALLPRRRPAGPGETALVVAHDAVVMLFLYLLLPMEEAELLEFAASHTVLNASVTQLARTETGWELVEFSAVDHLQREGAPVTVHPGSPDVEPRE